MPLKLIRDDITKLKVDAIVNAANPSLLGGGGVDGAIHAAAGPELLAECRTLGGCRTGEAKLTKGYNLPSRYVIHTVGPVYEDGKHGEEELLRACYRHSLEIAAKEGFETVAFPLISSGVYGYPKAEAMSVAVNEIANFLMTHELTVSLVIFDRRSYEIGSRLFPDMEAYIDDHYVEAHPPGTSSMNLAWAGAAREEQALFSECVMAEDKAKKPSEHRAKKPAAQAFVFQSAAKKREEARDPLQEALSHLDESFSEMLLRKIDEKGMTDAECYKKANLDRKHFSKIRSDRLYKPKKTTVIAFAVALRLTLDETKEMLEKAGFALSKSSKFDVIVEYFLMKGEYDVFKINEALFCYDQPLLGAG